MKMLILLCVITLINTKMLIAQNGTVVFNSTEKWVVSINDSLDILSGEEIALPVGKYFYRARPQISYTWPAIIVEGDFEVSENKLNGLDLHQSDSKSEIEADSYQPIVTSYKGKNYEPESQKHGTLKTSLLVSAITINWLSFYLKRQADDYYAQYKNASTPASIRDSFNKAEQFDNLASVALGLSTAAISTYIYLTITE